MGTLEAINTFPLTGGRAVSLLEAHVGPAGIDGDRRHIAYNTSTFGRVGMSQLPKLVRIRPEIDEYGALHLHGLDGDAALTIPAHSFSRGITIDEFTDATPALGCDDERIGATLTAFTGSRAPLNLAQKSNAWMQGGIINPAHRRNAPLHIINAATVRQFQRPGEGITYGPDRFRANFVIDGFDPLEELGWRGRLLKIGELLVLMTRLTERCNALPHHQITGENLKDVSRQYKEFPRAPGGTKPCMGIYGFPILPPGAQEQVAVGNSVTLTKPKSLPE